MLIRRAKSEKVCATLANYYMRRTTQVKYLKGLKAVAKVVVISDLRYKKASRD